MARAAFDDSSAQGAGNISVDARLIKGVHHTVSVLRSRANTLAYLKVGAHLRAMTAFKTIAMDKTFGYEAADVPC